MWPPQNPELLSGAKAVKVKAFLQSKTQKDIITERRWSQKYSITWKD